MCVGVNLYSIQVQNVSQNTVLNQEAYLLFYKKDNSRSPKVIELHYDSIDIFLLFTCTVHVCVHFCY